MSRALRVLIALLFCAATLAAAGGTAAAHEERPAKFPDGSGHRPQFLGWHNDRSRVVCKDSSPRAIARMPAGKVKDRNKRLLESCRFHSIQTAINSIKHRKTSVYVLPGTYREKKWATQKRSYYCSHLESSSNDLVTNASYIGSVSESAHGSDVSEEHSHSEGTDQQETMPRVANSEGKSNPIALSYSDQRRCAHNLNLIALFGDSTPKNKSIKCDSKFCGTQVVGTGRRQAAVTVDNKFAKLNGIRADRMGGFYLRGVRFQQAEFNSVYVLETDGFVLDRITTRANDEYGILAFASDHGLIQHTNNYFNGDSGIYPGSGSDINGDNTKFKPTRYAIEIRHNKSHDNTLGYSGTAGNSVWAHDNDFFHNSTGIVTDSFFPGHPGLPQDHARWSHNKIFSNNQNYYTKYVNTGVCDKPIAKRGYMQGTVCPVIPTPVGTGIWIAGGNYNSTDHNWIYDNWRYGTIQIWVPAPLRDDYDPTHLYDTSNFNHTFENQMGFTPSGAKKFNGIDHWWDDEGEGNCWVRNTYAKGERDDNFTVPPPSCADGGSLFTPGAFVKDNDFLSCSQYDRDDPVFRDPPDCVWFDTPENPDENASGGPSGPVATSQKSSAASSHEQVVLPLMSVSVLLLWFGVARRGRRAS